MLVRRRIQSLSASLRYYNSGSSSSDALSSPSSSYAKAATAGGIVVRELKDWFKRDMQQGRQLINQIFDILRASSVERDDRAFYLHLSDLHLCLTEKLVLDVLSHSRNDILSCLKFFDWAARQPGFHHTRATFHAIFKILRRAKLMPLMIEILDRSVDFQNYRHSLRLSDALVIGYAVAGRTDIALQHFGNMRFRGLDLDSFGYHVLLNALVEEKCFDTVDVIFDQISDRGFLNAVTHSILVKKFCKQGQLAEAEDYLRSLLSSDPDGCASGLGILIDDLCSKQLFQEATRLLDEIKGVGTVQMDRAYSIWIRGLIRAGFLDKTADFLQKISPLEGCVLEVVRYNSLIFKLLKENNLQSVYDILMEMMIRGVSPNESTMNAALCFFCKSGMVDEALELYRSRSEIGFSPTVISYNYLIHTLCTNGNVEQACVVLKGAIDRGHFLGSKTFGILTDALCEYGKTDMVKDLVLFASKRCLLPRGLMGSKIISALCTDGRVDDAIFIHEVFNRSGIATTFSMFVSLIYGSISSKRGDIATKLIIRMQEKGYTPHRSLFRDVIRSVCVMESGDNNFFGFLELQLSLLGHKVEAYNVFIEGAGFAGKPRLARLVYDMMDRDGISPTLDSNVLMLQSYVKNGKISDALHFFHELCQKGESKRRLYHVMIVGLCKADRVDDAIHFLEVMKYDGRRPSIECYELIIQKLCDEKKYEKAVGFVNEFRKNGWRLTSFIGNVLLYNALKSPGVHEAWSRMRDVEERIPEMKSLGELISLFSGRVNTKVEIKRLDEVIEKCYPLDIYTYNMLIRAVIMDEVGDAYELVNRIRRRGYEPNSWTYKIIGHGLRKQGRSNEADRWFEESDRRCRNSRQKQLEC